MVAAFIEVERTSLSYTGRSARDYCSAAPDSVKLNVVSHALLRNPQTELYLSAKSLRLWLGEARERWLAFLPKSGNTLGKIGSEKSQHLQSHGCFESRPCNVEPIVERAFRESHCLLGAVCELASNFHSPVHQLVRRDTNTHEPNSFGLFAVYKICGHQIILCFSHAT